MFFYRLFRLLELLWLVATAFCACSRLQLVEVDTDGSANESNADSVSTRQIEGAVPPDSTTQSSEDFATQMPVDVSHPVPPDSTTQMPVDASHPVEKPEASTGAAVESEASSRGDATQPSVVDLSWAESLIGSYAVRSDSFTANTDGIGEKLEYLFAVFLIEDDQVVLRIRTCDLQSTLISLGGAVQQTSRVPRTDSYLLRELVVVRKDNSWETISQPSYFGYLPDSPDECTPGESIPARQEQLAWLSGDNCRCYSSTSVPISIDDCRLLDSDGDGEPGVTVEFRGIYANDLYVTSVRSDRYIRGTFDPNGFHQANELTDSSGSLLSCQNTLQVLCSTGSRTACRPEASRVLFAPLASETSEGGELNCQSVMNQKDALLPTQAPDFSPDDC